MIEVHCRCGKGFRVPEAKAGARGKCPGCGQPLVVPGTADRKPPAPAPATSPCPVCRSTYAPGIVICLTCGIDLRTGRPLPPPEDDDIPIAELNEDGRGLPLAIDAPDPAAPRESGAASVDPPLEITRSSDGVLQLNFEGAPPPGIPTGPGEVGTGPAGPGSYVDPAPLDPDEPRRPVRQRERRRSPIVTAAEEAPRGFARLVLDMYLHPISTMESLTYTLSSWPMLAKMAAFYAASLIVLFLNAWLNPDVALGGGGSRTEATVDALALEGNPFKETEKYTGEFVMNIWVDPALPETGQPTRITAQISDNLQAKPLKGRVTADLFYEGWEDPERAAKPDVIGRDLVFTRGKAEDLFCLEQTFLHGGAYTAVVHIFPDPVDPDVKEAAREPADYEYGFIVKGYARSPGPSAQAFAVALFSTISSVLGLIITAVCVNLAGRFIGSGGTFVAMLVVLAFLTGVVNCTMTLMMILTPMLGPGAATVMNIVLVVWRTGLFLLALMKVYDVDFLLAVAISFFSNQIQMWTAFWFLGVLYKLAT